MVSIIILSRGRCGLSRCITYYLLATAMTDFVVIIFAVIINRISGIYFRYSSLSTTPACRLIITIIFAVRDASVWLTVAFTIDRSMAICCQSLKISYCTEKTALLVIGIVCALCSLKNIPFYFYSQPLYVLDGVSWFCDIKSSYYTAPLWQVYDMLEQILTPFLPFFLILLLNAITIRHILASSRARKRLRGADTQGDQEMTNRRRSIFLLFAISLSFLLLWATYVGRFLYVRVSGAGYFSGLNFSDPQYILQEMAIMLTLFSSCNNVFIYALSQTTFREEIKKILMCPFASIIGHFKC
ncbi:probable G-protein coupled receptor 139 [Chiloscyllium punctatum]|uniref:probable G-protein coupled receptor 139 n=1 Tax=Chiloscyllium punctatum TaxID=137246 RepID=UPI003B634DA7